MLLHTVLRAKSRFIQFMITFIHYFWLFFGHTLDIVMLRPSDDIVCSITVTQLLSSDHYCVVCDLSVIKPVNHAELKQSRNLHGINLTTFKADICQLISPTLCLTFAMLDDNLGHIFEKHALLYSCGVPINQNDPWYNAMKSAKNMGIGLKDNT